MPKQRKQLVNPSDLGDKLAPGLTQGISLKEVEQELDRLKPATPDGEEVVRRVVREQTVGRVPLPRFVGEDDAKSEMVINFEDGRAFRDTARHFPPDVMRALRAGMICLRCLEPQATAFGDDHLPGCEGAALNPRYMKERQIMDIAMEFEGEKHLGPQKPLREYLDEMDLRREMAEFDLKIAAGASRMKGLHGK